MREILVWKDKAIRCVSKSMVVGHLAMWAVRQSPYLTPDSLSAGIREFSNGFKAEEFDHMDLADLKGRIKAAIESSPIVLSWNNSKKGKHEIVFVSRFSEPHPDYDFIDLGALAGNVGRSVWLENLYDDGYFESNQKEPGQECQKKS